MRSPTRVITCGVFRPALEYLELENRYPHVHSTFLPSSLHLRPKELEIALRREISLAKKRNEKVVCLYGDCLPDMVSLCHHLSAVKVPGFHCFEMLLGSTRYQQIIDETPGTYFLEREIILNFEEYCLKPLELYDEEVKKTLFEHYESIVYVKQSSDPDLLSKARKLATFLQLSLQIWDADYSHLEKILTDLV